MADGFDFGTLASAILPAAAGLLSGGGFTGAMYGAARGVGRLGEVGMQQQEFDLKKQEAESRQAMAEKRYALDEKEFAERQKRNAVLNQEAEAGMRAHEVALQESKEKLQTLQTDRAAREQYRKSITDPTKQAEFDLDPDAYIKRQEARELESKTSTQIAKALQKRGIKEADPSMGSKVLGPLYANILEHQMNDKPHAQFVPEMGGIVTYDPRNPARATFTKIPGVTPTARSSNYVAIRRQMYQEWLGAGQANPQLMMRMQNMTQEDIQNEFDSYFASEAGVNKFKLLAKQMGIEDYAQTVNNPQGKTETQGGKSGTKVRDLGGGRPSLDDIFGKKGKKK